MKTALHTLLTVTALLLPARSALADGPYGEYPTDPSAYGQDPNQPGYQYPNAQGYQNPNAQGYQDPNGQGYQDPNGQGYQDPNGQPYQPPPDGVCLDDNNQSFDCSKDNDYASYSQIDDGYDPNAYQDFQETLSPYGSWENNEQYGQVWVPSAGVVGTDFTPYYSGGRWTMTDYGWTWVSDYNWGWAPFHYGRWISMANRGWGWVPGRIWGPSWVHWRLGGGYVGWSPLPPRGVRIAAPFMGGGYRGHAWNFVPMAQITAPRLLRVAPSLAASLYMRTTVATDLRSIGHSRIVYGPPLNHFAAASIRITPTPLHALQMAMPRSSIVMRPGIPLASRTYYAPHVRPAPGLYGSPHYQPGQPMRPGYGQPGYGPAGHPPGYMHPGYPQPGPGVQRPMNFPHVGPPPPATMQTPGYQHPGYQQPAYQHPTYQQPAYQHPSYQQPAYQHPTYQQPAYQQPAYQQPAYQHPSYQQPAYQHPTYQAPPRPSYQAPPAYHAPAPQMHSAPAPQVHSAPAPATHVSAPAPTHHR